LAKPEQTEKPTPKRRSEARKKGQVARSQELGGAAIFFVLVFVLYGFLQMALPTVFGMVQLAFERAGTHHDFTLRTAWILFAQSVTPVFGFLGIVFAVSFLVGILANVAQFGLIFSLKAITPTFKKLNPATGIQRLFSKQSLVNLGKQIAKLTAVAFILATSVGANIGLFAAAGQTTPAAFIFMLANLIFEVGWKFGLMLIVVGLIDYFYMRWQFEDSLKMTKQEVKAYLKRKQREFARRRMMSAVPRATVVVTNPTHYAVALEWDEVKMDAPVVTAKGADLIARRIRQIAEENDVPVMENPPLARTLYERVELDQAIPPNLYAAVAQVIAFVFKLKRKTIA
jgi:flagellar biosynthetic protein FlhB